MRIFAPSSRSTGIFQRDQVVHKKTQASRLPLQKSASGVVIRASWKLIFVAAAWLFVLGAAGLWLSGRDTRYLNIAAGPLSSESFELSTAIAEVLQETTGNIQVDVFETQGSAENARLLESGQVDMATLQADTPISHGVRALATLYYDAYQLIVRQDSGIHNVADLAGHRIAIPPAASGQNRSFWFLVEHYGIDVDDLVALPMSDDAANFAMHQGQVDAIFRVRAPGNALVNELVRNQGDMRLIAIDQPAALALTVPTIDPGIIPRGSYRGSPAVPVEDTQTAVLDRVLVAREELDERKHASRYPCMRGRAVTTNGKSHRSSRRTRG
jgi:TRAP transporter TAXI family solute receptor